MNLIKRFIRDEQGMETVEWAVLAALIVLATVTAIGTVGQHVTNKFTQLGTNTQ